MDRIVAHSCHEHRQLYTVVAKAPCLCSKSFSSAIEFQGIQIKLIMLDNHYRDYLTCHFQERNNGKIFLENASYREYRGDSVLIALTEEYAFQEEGSVLFEKHHFQDGVVALRTDSMDVFWNWEPYPAFGDYDSMLEIRWVCNLE